MMPGTKVGPYEVLSAIGAGGMGEVYRAHDPKLGRDVAIKVLPEAFARDAERMARFQREAKVLASLNHPNIATIHGLEDSGDTHALVMELVEGPTLADRIKAGPIPVDESIRIARQIADALEYAHERGIIHRDLKPANVKVTNDDAVKVLDFGLAKALEGDPSSMDISTSPTISRMATQAGVLLGTAAYMSPEQAKAKTVDRRADIWAFGCVLYEVLTGKQAFKGETVTESLAAVIMKDPDWSQLPAATPIRVRVLLQRCLQKDPKQRLRDIGDARISLDEVLAGAPEPAASLVAVGRPVKKPWQMWIVSGVACLLALATAAFAFLYFHQRPPSVRAMRLEITLPERSNPFGVTVSPDGSKLAFIAPGTDAQSRVWVRPLEALDAQPLNGTEGATGLPFWSPDSRFVAFSTQEGKLKKIDTERGSAQVLCDSGISVVGGFWTPDGKIVFGDPLRPPFLFQVPVAGGVSSPLLGVEHGNPSLASPVLLPGGRGFLFMSGSFMSGDVYVGSLDNKLGQTSSKKLLTGSVLPVYAPSLEDPDRGYLLFVRGTGGDDRIGPLMAQPFDLRKLELVGEPVLIAQQVSSLSVSASRTGTLIYTSGAQAAITPQLAIFDRQGKILGTAGEPALYTYVALSPDGRRAVTGRLNTESGSESLWMMDLERSISTRFTFDSGFDEYPVWSPDGHRIAFASTRGGAFSGLFQKLSNGGGDEELLFKPDYAALPISWSGDGRFLMVGGGPTTSEEKTVSVLPLDANGHAAGKPFPFVQKGVGIEPKFSPGPQGHPLWVAYSSNESGRYEIYVRPFDPNSPTGTPPGGGKWQVSTEGGVSPRWNSNGKELFYVALDGTVMSVEVSSGVMFQSGVPKALFKPQGQVIQVNPDYCFWDASSDGKKFIFAMARSANAAPQTTRFTVVLNWPSLLKK